MRKWITLAAGVALLPLQAAFAQAQAPAQADWVDVSAAANGTCFYALANELVPAKTATAEPTVWIRQTPTPAQGVAWYEGHALYQVNCQGQSYKILKVTLFYRDGTSQSHSGEEVVRRVTPQTPLADLASRVCPAASQAPGKLTVASSGPPRL